MAQSIIPKTEAAGPDPAPSAEPRHRGRVDDHSHSGGRSGQWKRFFLSWFALPGAALAALLVGALLILAFGANPLTGYHALITGAFGGRYALASTAVKAVPLLLVGIGICIAFRAN